MSTPKQEATSWWAALNLLWISLLAVVVWPVLGILATRHFFDEPSEALLIFGGFIACLLALPAMLFGDDNFVFAVAIIVVWFLMWLIPMIWLIRRPRTLGFQALVIGLLSAISFSQAALGCLMIFGKGV